MAAAEANTPVFPSKVMRSTTIPAPITPTVINKKDLTGLKDPE